MKCLRSSIYILILLSITCFSQGIPIHRRLPRQTEASYTVQCNNKQMFLSCSGEDKVIRVESANYGRTDDSTCPSGGDMTNTNCHAEGAFEIVSESCNGLSLCRIQVNAGTFNGHPCPGTAVYLAVSYLCEIPTSTGTCVMVLPFAQYK